MEDNDYISDDADSVDHDHKFSPPDVEQVTAEDLPYEYNEYNEYIRGTLTNSFYSIRNVVMRALQEFDPHLAKCCAKFFETHFTLETFLELFENHISDKFSTLKIYATIQQELTLFCNPIIEIIFELLIECSSEETADFLKRFFSKDKPCGAAHARGAHVIDGMGMHIIEKYGPYMLFLLDPFTNNQPKTNLRKGMIKDEPKKTWRNLKGVASFDEKYKSVTDFPSELQWQTARYINEYQGLNKNVAPSPEDVIQTQVDLHKINPAYAGIYASILFYHTIFNFRKLRSTLPLAGEAVLAEVKACAELPESLQDLFISYGATLSKGGVKCTFRKDNRDKETFNFHKYYSELRQSGFSDEQIKALPHAGVFNFDTISCLKVLKLFRGVDESFREKGVCGSGINKYNAAVNEIKGHTAEARYINKFKGRLLGNMDLARTKNLPIESKNALIEVEVYASKILRHDSVGHASAVGIFSPSLLKLLVDDPEGFKREMILIVNRVYKVFIKDSNIATHLFINILENYTPELILEINDAIGLLLNFYTQYLREGKSDVVFDSFFYDGWALTNTLRKKAKGEISISLIETATLLCARRRVFGYEKKESGVGAQKKGLEYIDQIINSIHSSLNERGSNIQAAIDNELLQYRVQCREVSDTDLDTIDEAIEITDETEQFKPATGQLDALRRTKRIGKWRRTVRGQTQRTAPNAITKVPPIDMQLTSPETQALIYRLAMFRALDIGSIFDTGSNFDLNSSGKRIGALSAEYSAIESEGKKASLLIEAVEAQGLHDILAERVHTELPHATRVIMDGRRRVMGLMPIGGKIETPVGSDPVDLHFLMTSGGLGLTPFTLKHADRSLVLPPGLCPEEVYINMLHPVLFGLYDKNDADFQMTIGGRMKMGSANIVGPSIYLNSPTNVVHKFDAFQNDAFYTSGRCMVYDAGIRKRGLPFDLTNADGRTDMCGRRNIQDIRLYQLFGTMAIHRDFDGPYKPIMESYSKYFTRLMHNFGYADILHRSPWIVPVGDTLTGIAHETHAMQLQRCNEAWRNPAVRMGLQFLITEFVLKPFKEIQRTLCEDQPNECRKMLYY